MKKSLIALGCFGIIAGTQLLKAQDAAKGKAVFDDNCIICHNADSEERKMGPGLKGVSKRPELVNGTKVSDKAIGDFVNAGGNGMPGFGDLLSTQEKTDLLAYLKSL